MLIEPDWPAPPGVRCGVTTRAGGVSTGAYASLNLGDHVGDDPDRVTENRRRLEAALSLPEAPRWLAQVHGSRVLRLPAEAVGAGDGAVTEAAGVVCAVLTADCLPVLLARQDGSAVGVVHAGWRGLAAGVLANAVGMLGGPPEAMLAWLGPAITAPAYEVGPDVHDALMAADLRLGAALTANAASLAGAANRIGTIEPGKIADLVVTDGDLFDDEMQVRHVFVDGRPVSIEQESDARPTARRGQ